MPQENRHPSPLREPPRDYIEHIPNEKRPPWWFWWGVWAVVGVVWLASADSLDWRQIALGGFTGIMFASWAIDMNGGISTPASWRGKPRSRR